MRKPRETTAAKPEVEHGASARRGAERPRGGSSGSSGTIIIEGLRDEGGYSGLADALAFASWGRYGGPDVPHGIGDDLGWGEGEPEESDADAPDPSVSLYGSDLSQAEQRRCAVERLGIFEEDVDWFSWSITVADTPYYGFPGPSGVVWHRFGGDIDGMETFFATCSGTIVFARKESMGRTDSVGGYVPEDRGGRSTGAARWEVWAYRSPGCTAEGLSSAWLDRYCG